MSSASPSFFNDSMTDTTFYIVTLGYKSTLKTLRSGKAKLVIIAGNTPPLRTYFRSPFSSLEQILSLEIFLGSVYFVGMFQDSIPPV